MRAINGNLTSVSGLNHAGIDAARSPYSRREFVSQLGAGFGGLALMSLLAERAGAAGQSPLAIKPPHFSARAKRVIMLFMFGGPSHLDTFDYNVLSALPDLICGDFVRASLWSHVPERVPLRGGPPLI